MGQTSLTRLLFAIGFPCALATTSAVARAQAGPYLPDSLTVLLYHCDEDSGHVVPDATGHGFDGNAVNVTWEAAGRYGAGLRLDGDAYVDVAWVPHSPLPRSSDLTYEAWVYRTANVPCTIVSSLGTTLPSGDGRDLSIDSAGRLVAYAVRSHEGGSSAQGITSIPLGRWVQVAGVFDETHGRVAVYVDGVIDGEGTLTPGYRGSNWIRIGATHWDSHFFQGILDEIRISAVARTFRPLAVEAASWGRLKERYRGP